MTKGTAKLADICRSVLESADLGSMAGIAIGLLVGNETFVDAAGYRNYASKDKMKPDDVFHCASISKTFTSTAIMKLVEQKKLDLQDKLVDLLPYLSIADKRCEKIRLHHMLSHIAGLQDMVELDWTTVEKGEDALRKHAVSDEVKSVILNSDPDDMQFLYSDLCYDLLGLIIQEKSGQTFEEFIAENFFIPAGMKNTTFLTFERTGGSLELDDVDRAGLAMPHSRDISGAIAVESVYPYSREHAPSSTLTSNISDLLKWARFNLDKKAVSAESYDKMWTERVDAPDKDAEMGMGWFIRKQNGCRLVGHEGGDVGFRTSFWTCPQLDAAMVILSNTSESPIEPLNEKFLSAVVETL